MTDEALVYRVPMRHPGDVSGVAALIDSCTLEPTRIMAVLGKTEGNGCVNDHTRGYAVLALQVLLAERLGTTRTAVADRVAIVMSGGTEGGLSPHFTVFATRPGAAAPTGNKALAIGVAHTPDIAPADVGRVAQVECVAAAVRQAMQRAGIADPADIHYVQVKCPLLTSERVAAATGAVVTADTYKSMAFSRGASALGVALALGEVSEVSNATVLHDLSRWSGRASASAGIELMRNEVMVLGNSAAWSGPLRIAHGVMADAIDFDTISGVLGQLGFATGRQLDSDARGRIRAVLAKADPGSTGYIRGQRHTMLDDSDINATRHARALVGGVVAAATGQTDLFVSGGAEHQGPDGGGPIAIIADISC
jgi:cyanuric acid amidohydrolase